ncbi:hypothetical protein B0T19DRAFT_50748 [Cercophora scortea]|uniref:Uncharacterized protein n=1 Tax=Cercophora scortea TaxID=314031 RepID=A0AAE0MLP5_9PEZI|nr:hypothetical protein B0T19DRAFT_50748 [Cercophora scortea]
MSDAVRGQNNVLYNSSHTLNTCMPIVSVSRNMSFEVPAEPNFHGQCGHSCGFPKCVRRWLFIPRLHASVRANNWATAPCRNTWFETTPALDSCFFAALWLLTELRNEPHLVAQYDGTLPVTCASHVRDLVKDACLRIAGPRRVFLDRARRWKCPGRLGPCRDQNQDLRAVNRPQTNENRDFAPAFTPTNRSSRCRAVVSQPSTQAATRGWTRSWSPCLIRMRPAFVMTACKRRRVSWHRARRRWPS